jgi:hypothetical protein
MVMGQLLGGGGNGGNGGGMEQAMMKMLFPDLFDDEVIAAWDEPVAIGSRRNAQGYDESATITLHLLEPTPTAPKARLRLLAGGPPINIRPDELLRLQRWITNVMKEKVTAHWLDGTVTEGNIEELLAAARDKEGAARSRGLLTGAVSGG